MALSGQLHALAVVDSKKELSLSLYRRTPLSTGDTFQDLRETADNTEHYIYNVIFM